MVTGGTLRSQRETNDIHGENANGQFPREKTASLTGSQRRANERNSDNAAPFCLSQFDVRTISGRTPLVTAEMATCPQGRFPRGPSFNTYVTADSRGGPGEQGWGRCVSGPRRRTCWEAERLWQPREQARREEAEPRLDPEPHGDDSLDV